MNIFFKALYISQKKLPNLVSKILATKFGFVPDWSVIYKDTPAPTAKMQTTCVTLTFCLLTWKWYMAFCPLMGYICATYEIKSTK